MPKIKTRKAAAKRFTKLASGKIKRRQANVGHIMTKKTTKRKRQLRKGAYVKDVDVPRLLEMMPY
jgi:large subunit ribosomal protein L35